MSSFTYIYILQSESNPSHFYTGRTADLRERLDRHNSGKGSAHNEVEAVANQNLHRIFEHYACR
jgi:predicted GIY-YIG superfamily endonuclease